MAARELNTEIIRGLSEEIRSFYGKTESKYWKALPSEAVSEKLAIQDLFKELHRLKEDCLKSYSRRSARDKLTVSSCNLHNMACRELDNWKRSIIRREFFVAKHSNPWIVEFSYRLHKEIFDHLVEILTCTSMYGVNIQNHLKRNGEVKEKVIKVSHKRKLERWFSDGQMTGEVGFRRSIKGKGHTDLLVDANKPFQLKYIYSTEMVQIKCHYGVWNEEGVPQFI